MAAPPEAYTGFSLFTGDCEHVQAKLDQDYNTFKTRFYLDDVIGGKEGVIGCVIPNGTNALFHNMATRGGKGRIGNMTLLNDGGINTKALPNWVSGVGYYGSVYNGFIVTVECFSAYHVDTDNFGIKWTATSGNYTGAPALYKTDGILKQESDMSGFLLVDQVVVDSNIYFKVISNNAEGTFESVEYSLLVNKPVISVGFDPVYASYAYTDFLADEFTIKVDTFGIDVGTQIYNGTGSSPWSSVGYFCNNDIWFQTNSSGVVISAGMRGSWPAGDPATPASAYPYTFYHFGGSLSTYPTTCSLLSMPGNNTPTTVWQSTTDNKWYTTSGLTTLAPNGYYWLDNTNWQIFSSGQHIGIGDCASGPIIE